MKMQKIALYLTFLLSRNPVFSILLFCAACTQIEAIQLHLTPKTEIEKLIPTLYESRGVERPEIGCPYELLLLDDAVSTLTDVPDYKDYEVVANVLTGDPTEMLDENFQPWAPGTKRLFPRIEIFRARVTKIFKGDRIPQQVILVGGISCRGGIRPRPSVVKGGIIGTFNGNTVISLYSRKPFNKSQVKEE